MSKNCRRRPSVLSVAVFGKVSAANVPTNSKSQLGDLAVNLLTET